ncbi:hypothetical protein [Streptomyces violascens]|uniref:Uncharacterized protein n=1 Tax=Streptomyces violascens TaxID=67381 RepID=A0ABQ3QX95_9ACTN|nr:hypothetical protein [Streptomyces violascens]GGU13162.1 hypothetical protein GCM10010289_38520 [Streptomyces violascens]GHI41902.1 hypothetical protein Sviol_63100 [Streptomyces violascens]
MTRHEDWFRIYDSAPVSDVDIRAAYTKEISVDGAVWECPHEMTGEHLKLDMTEALIAERTVGLRNGVVVIESPYPMGGLIRYTPTAHVRASGRG